MTPLIEKLSAARQPVSLIRYKDIDDVREAVERGLVLLKFTATQGGTEIGMQLNQSGEGFKMTAEEMELSGTLTLDYHSLICTVNIDPATLTGHGSLKALPA
ncbi:MAG TPA: hypothetical protein VF472_23425 [Burkholderiaceae bacterium]|jgi:hypothetical protein